MDDDDDRLLITVDEAATRLALSRREVYRMLSSGELRSVRVGRRSRRIVVADLNKAMEEMRRRRRSVRLPRRTPEEAEAADRAAADALGQYFMADVPEHPAHSIRAHSIRKFRANSRDASAQDGSSGGLHCTGDTP